MEINSKILGPAPKEPFNILFSDSFSYRHVQLRVRAGASNKDVSQTHCHSAAELIYTLQHKKWDVVFIPSFFQHPSGILDIMQHFVKLDEEKRPRLVIFHGTDDTYDFVKTLREAGYLATMIPWDFATPNNHTRKDPETYLGYSKVRLISNEDN